MTFEPGIKKVPGSGRKKGTPNKPKPQDAARTALAVMALRHMQPLEDLLKQLLEDPRHYDRMDVAKLMLRLMSAATRGKPGMTEELIERATTTPAPAAKPYTAPPPPTAQERFDQLLFDKRFTGVYYQEMALRLSRQIDREKGEKPIELADLSKSLMADPVTSPPPPNE